MVRLAFGFALALSALANAADDPPPVLTVCEVLSDLPRYQAQTVVVIGRQASTFEGAWLSEDCGIKVMNGGREFEPSISLSYRLDLNEPAPKKPAGVVISPRVLLEKLDQVKRTTRIRYSSDTWAAIFGRLESKLPTTLSFGVPTMGFGHLSMSPAQLIYPDDGKLKIPTR